MTTFILWQGAEVHHQDAVAVMTQEEMEGVLLEAKQEMECQQILKAVVEERRLQED